MSKSQNRYDGIDPYVVSQVRYHARQMLRHHTMAGMEIEDIEQELMLDYLSRIQSFDPEKSCRKTFADRILRHKCAAMIKAAKAEKRNGGFHAASLDSYLEDGDHDDIPESMAIWGSHPNHARQVDLTIDVTDAIRALPEAARFYCAMLMQDLPIRTLCKIHNRHPSTVYETIGRIRRDFDERGLQKYLH
jgi:RNA polymerase sigma factor (sigma-70 family)